MSDLANAADGAREEGAREDDAREDGDKPAGAQISQRSSGQVLSITFDPDNHSATADIERNIASGLNPMDTVLPVGRDSFVILFDEDDTDTALRTSKQAVQKMAKANLGHFECQLVDIRPQGGKPVRTVVMETTSSEILQSATTDDEQGQKKSTDEEGTSGFEVGYAPMWNIRNEVLMGYAVLPVIRDTEEGDLYGRKVLGPSTSPEQLHMLDAQMLNTQINTAESLIPKKFTSLLVSQIHFDTLSSSASRKTTLEIAKKIPPYMKGNLMASIVDIPASTPSSTLAQRISGLSEYFRAISINIPSSDFPIAPCAAMGATSVSYRIPADLSNAAIIAEVRKIIDAAKSAKLLTVFEDVSSLNLAVALKKLGGVFITGTCLGGIDEAPGNMKPLTVKDLQVRSQAA